MKFSNRHLPYHPLLAFVAHIHNSKTIAVAVNELRKNDIPNDHAATSGLARAESHWLGLDALKTYWAYRLALHGVNPLIRDWMGRADRLIYFHLRQS